MPPLDAFGPSLAIGLVILVMGWFAFGTQRNIRRGNDVLRWLQGGLPMIGRRTTLQWLGSSAAQLTMADADAPFRDATVTVVLEPRDVPPLWAYARYRGRRDFLIVRANLRQPPRYVLEAWDPGSWTGRNHAPDAADAGESTSWVPGAVAHAGPGADAGAARDAWERLAALTDGVWRIAVQPVVPHLEVHLRPAAPERATAAEVLAPIRDLAAALATRPRPRA
jgi:hypothetical protein